MGTVYPNPSGKDLYDFWGDNLANQINLDLKNNKSKFIINLASQEYYKAAQGAKINGQIISPSFLDEKNGKYKIISFYAKKARGYMANYLISNRVNDPLELEKFNHYGYRYSKGDSSADKPVFTRSEKQRIAA